MNKNDLARAISGGYIHISMDSDGLLKYALTKKGAQEYLGKLMSKKTLTQAERKKAELLSFMIGIKG